MQDASLFRTAAIEYKRRGQFSKILTPPHINHVWIMCILMLIALLTSSWLLNRYYIRDQTITGSLQPDRGLLIHRANVLGRIGDIKVSAGERVAVGQVLMTLESMDFMQGGASINTEQLLKLKQRLASLDEQDARTERLANLKLANLNTEYVAAQQQLAHLEVTEADQTTILNIAEKRLSNLRSLMADGHIAKTAVDEAEADLKQLKIQQRRLERDILTAKDNIKHLHNQQLQLPLETETLLANSHQQRLQIKQAILEAEGRAGQIVVAASDGIVDEINVHAGEEVNIGQGLIHLLPAGSNLIGELYIPTYAAGFVEAGQQLKVRYHAYPYQKYGIYHAEIVSMSETPLSDHQQQFFYTAKIKLQDANIMANGRKYALKTGMSFEADVMLSRRTFIEWLFEPLYSLKGG